ncbi:hypothetical protein KR222_006639 [Zaprionus bogoriensis]|nr:hypothetical protein KR222_006639 [Zaprionus bogoriensis]
MPYDLIDVVAATSAGVGRPKSGQTTRIYTTGDVNDEFWLKHLGDDFKHAIHLQVGGTNDDYNRIINQTNSAGVHEEVHHEYLPGAERPPEAQQQQHQQHQQHQQPQQHQQQQHLVGADGYGQSNVVSQLSLDGEAMALKQNYLRQQEQQRFGAGYAQPSLRYNSNNNNNNNMNNRHTYNTHLQRTHHTQHTQHTPQTAQHTRTHGNPRHSLRNRYKKQHSLAPNPNQSSIIHSSEDTLHAQTQAQPLAAPTSQQASAPSSSALRRDEVDNPLPFKSPFNDYGSRPTRDLTYLLYKRGL